MNRARQDPRWLLLVLTLPGHQPALRMRLWRKLKTAGVGVVRDGVYVAPDQPALRELLATQAEELIAAGGMAQLLTVESSSGEFAALFDRSAEYRVLLAAIGSSARSLKASNAKRLATKAQTLRREYESIVSRDFLPGTLQGEARQAIDHLNALIERHLSPDEPHAVRGRMKKYQRAEFAGRTWVTRERPWVDRLASAWLIRRFVDPAASFRWLKTPAVNGTSVGFDFDGAAFSHVDDKVTFEVLMHSFGLEQDAALGQVAGVVHYLDVGGVPVAEAPAIEVLLRGIRERAPSDDALFSEASRLFDDLYAGFAQAGT